MNDNYAFSELLVEANPNFSALRLGTKTPHARLGFAKTKFSESDVSKEGCGPWRETRGSCDLSKKWFW